MPLTKTFLVVKSGKPRERSNLICLPKTLFNLTPVEWLIFHWPLSKISFKRLRYWYSGCEFFLSIEEYKLFYNKKVIMSAFNTGRRLCDEKRSIWSILSFSGQQYKVCDNHLL